MHARGVLEPAQPLRLVCKDALRLLLVVRPAGMHHAIGGPTHVRAGVNAHVFEVVAHAARFFPVKHPVFGVHHYARVVERGRGRRGGHWGHQLVRVIVFGWSGGGCDPGGAQHRHGNIGFGVVGDRETAVEHVPAGGAEGGVQVAGRRRRQQVLALRHVQQVGITVGAGHRGGRGVHGAHVLGPVPLRQNAPVLR